MARLLGIVANRFDRLRPILLDARIAHVAAATKGPAAWGFVFYQGDELLHQKRPVAEGVEVTLSDLPSDDVRTDCALFWLGPTRGGAFRPQDVGPFRYKRWAFAATRRDEPHADAREALLETLPDHLRRGVAGSTLDEVIFSAILAEIHDAGRIDDPDIAAATVEEAIRRALARPGLRENGGDAFAAVLTNGVRTFGIARGLALDHASRVVIAATDSRVRDGELRATLLLDAASPSPLEGFHRSREHALLTIDRDLAARESAL